MRLILGTLQLAGLLEVLQLTAIFCIMALPNNGRIILSCFS